MNFVIRKATLDDQAEIAALIARSVCGLGREPEQSTSAIIVHHAEAGYFAIE